VSTLENTSVPIPSGLSVRLRDGVRRRSNWAQLCKFAAVGASGYVVNLVVFAICVHGVGIDYRLAAAIAFTVAVANNFLLNRLWTFASDRSAARTEALRFFVVSLVSFGFTLLVLQALVEAGTPRVLGEAVAIAVATPLNFVGNKLWTFRRR
jgi:putative flippase GtrA